ncbi:MAG TPA: hypothetical protein VF411_07880 [Bacteroidia bacterium]
MKTNYIKKSLMAASLVCALSLNSHAQCIEQGKVIVDAYYGFPNLYGTIFKALVSSASATNVAVSSIGPIGIKGEYLLTDKFGLGVDFNYSNVTIKDAEVNQVYNSTTGV